jgi:tol-pal system protein YbgF
MSRLLVVLAMFVAAVAGLAPGTAWSAPSRSELDERLVQLERIVENQGLQRVELARQLEALQAELRVLRGQVEELGFALEGARGQQRQQYLDLDGRLQSVEERTQTLVEAAAAAATPGEDPDAVYQAAFDALKEGRYPEARAGFETFLQAYPDHELAANAQYWIGEVYYVDKDFAAALDAFRKVFETHPQARKVPDALLKAGYCHYELKQFAAARERLRRVVADFPGSSAAREAAGRLERMDAEGR